MGKIPVLCNDSPGFIVNRVARPYYLEALHLLENNIGDIEAIDRLMEASGFRMGPFKLMDLIGNDINFSVSCIVHDALGKPERLRPSAVQEKKVKEGALGRKSGNRIKGSTSPVNGAGYGRFRFCRCLRDQGPR